MIEYSLESSEIRDPNEYKNVVESLGSDIAVSRE